MKARIVVGEVPSFSYPRIFYPEKKIDRTGMTVEEFFEDQKIVWGPNLSDVDVLLRKTELSFDSPLCEMDEKARIEKYSSHPCLLVIQETREAAPMAYQLADPKATLAIAPGENLQSMFDAAEWRDPQLENWKKREDRACWIGRPTDERIQFAQQLIKAGVKLDIYSDDPWPLAEWIGRAESSVETARKYKYRFVYESSLQHRCHSEKLFQSLLSGCVSFYIADPNLKLHFLDDLYLNWSKENWNNREDLASKVLARMNQFLFSSEWEVYSYREYYLRILKAAEKLILEKKERPYVRTPFEDYPQSKFLFEAGVQALASQNYLKANENFLKVEEILGPIFFVQLHQGVTKMRMQDFDTAERIFRDALLRYPMNHECLLNLAVLRSRQGKFEDSVRMLQDLIKIYPGSGLAYRNLGRCLTQLGRLQEARGAYEEGLQVCPHDQIMRQDLANLSHNLAH